MAKHPMLIRVDSPRIDVAKFAVEQREAISSVSSTLSDMAHYAQDFWGSLALFDHCAYESGRLMELFSKNFNNQEARDSSDVYGRWIFVAARDACLCIYHFGRARDGLHQTLGQCPALRSAIDRDALRAANNLFDRHFPNYVRMRHAIAHVEETQNTPQAIEKHALSSGAQNPFVKNPSAFKTLVVTNNLMGRTYSSMWDGELIEADISEENAHKLDEIREAYFGVFRPWSYAF
jgi:hypothetical protein